MVTVLHRNGEAAGLTSAKEPTVALYFSQLFLVMYKILPEIIHLTPILPARTLGLCSWGKA